MSPSNGNGSQRVLWWIIGAILGPIVLVSFTSILGTTYTSAAKVSALEAHLLQLQRDIERMHEKLDRLLGRQP